MLIRIFTRTSAKAVQPGFIIEQPKAMRVEEVHNTLTGLRIWGRRPNFGDDSPRVSIEATPDTAIELPVADRDSVLDLLRSAFDALRAKDKDDEVEQPFEWEWLPDEQTFVLMSVAHHEPLHMAFAPAVAPKGTTAPVKRTRKGRSVPAKTTPPPADAEPDIST